MSNPADVVTSLASARRGVQLYPPTHPAFNETLDALIAAVQEGTVAGPFVINWHLGHLYHESAVFPDDVHGAASLAEAFESRKIESMSLQPGFDRTDAIALTEVLSLKPGPELDIEAELAARSARNITISRLEDEEDEEQEEREKQRQADKALYQRTLSALRKLQERFKAGGSGDLGDTGQLVGSVMERLLTDHAAVLGLTASRGGEDAGLFHSLNVMIYSLALGNRLGLPEEGLSSLGMSALLHDVGKAAFDLDDPEQFEPMGMLHPKVGAEILQRTALEDPAPMLVAYEHHMYADGGGWPDHDADYVAHPYSRMVAIANRYEGFLAPMDGSEPMTPDKAIVEVLHEAGTILDPFFTKLFANALGVFPVGCLVRLTDHSVGVVIATTSDPLAPKVKLVFDENGNDLEEYQELDLMASDVTIVEVIDPRSLNVNMADLI
jgi:HD-GYP domain-containing protein (c-di-GMP phosphodiesterase class II)